MKQEGDNMIQFEYNSVLNRYDVKVPYNIAEEGQEMVTVATISETSKVNLLRELSIPLIRQILLNWDEYELQASREFDDLFDNKKKGDK